MKINMTQFNNFKLLFLISLMIFFGSCRNQASQKDLQAPILQVEKLAKNSDPELDQISQVVRTIFQDSKGRLWFGTQGGAFKVEDNSLIHIDDIKGESGKGVTIKEITEDKDGKIWLGHTDGVSSIDGDEVVNYYESDGLINMDVWSIAADSKGNIWIGTIDGACVFNGEVFTKFELPKGEIDPTRGISSAEIVHSIMEDRSGTLWFSTNAGLFSYSDKTLINVSEKLGIPTNFINEIFEDEKGEKWISTKTGLYHLTGNKLTNITNDKITGEKGIGCIGEDEDGKIWFVGNQHHLYSYDKHEIIEFQKTEENKGPGIFEIFKDQDDRIWCVGFGGAFRFENGKFINIKKDGPW